MVVNEVYVDSLGSVEPEDDAPVPGYANAPEVASIAFQPMQAQARQVHVMWLRGVVQGGQNSSDAGYQVGIDSSRVSSLVEPL